MIRRDPILSRPHRRLLVVALALALLTALLAGLLVGCATEEDETVVNSTYTLEIVGNYLDEYSSDHQVTASTWTSFGGGSVIHIIAYSNEENFLLGQNDAVNSFNPNMYARQDWTYFNGSLYYCSTVYDGATLQDAYAGSADSSNPTLGGCGGFSWTNLTP
jgi:hypothetical protein